MKSSTHQSSSSIRVLLLSLTVIFVLTSTACIRRQTTPRAEAAEQPNAGRISLQDEPQADELSELAVPQLEEEKQPDYTFNKAENLFDINLESQELRPTLQSMCDMLSLNLVMDPEVQDTLTINLRDVTFFKFLEVVLEKKKH